MSLLEAKVKECFDIEALQVLAFGTVGLSVVDGGLGIGAFGVCGRAGPGGAEGFGRGVLAQAIRLAERTASLAELDAAVNAGAATRTDTVPNPGGTAL